MDNSRFFLFLIIALLALNLYLQLVAPPSQEPEETAVTEEVIAPGEARSLSEADRQAAARTSALPVSQEYPDRDPIVVETGVYRIAFDVRGACPRRWELTDPTYRHIGDENAEVVTDEHAGIPQIIPQLPPDIEIATDELPLQVELSNWPLADDFNRLNWNLVEGPVEDSETGTIRLVFESPERGGLILTKEYTLHHPHDDESNSPDLADHAGGYLSELRIGIRNVSSQRIVLSDEAVGMTLTWGPGIGIFERTGFYNTRSPLVFLDDGTWYRSPSENRPREVAAENPNGIEWAGLQSRYFLAAIVPAGDEAPTIPKASVELRQENIPSNRERWRGYTPLMTVGLLHPTINLAPGEAHITSYDLYVGPKHRPHLIAAGHDLDRADYYSSWFWMRGLCIFLTLTLNGLYAIVGNYGWAILILTICIRLLLYPITHRQMKIMAKTQREMARVKPFIDEVREKHKGDAQRIQRETMAIYREHGVNPFAGLKGCLPMLLQMPIFFALFIMLRSSIALRGASWLWIDDLSGPDALIWAPWLEQVPLVGRFLGPTINLLPILMAVTQWGTMRISQTQASDPNQRMMMNLMPIMLTVMLFRAPSGLMIYWVAGNFWQMGHQYLTNKSVQHHEEMSPTPAPVAPATGGKGKGKDKGKTSRGAQMRSAMAEKRAEAKKAREKAMSESSSLPRWARRGGR